MRCSSKFDIKEKIKGFLEDGKPEMTHISCCEELERETAAKSYTFYVSSLLTRMVKPKSHDKIKWCE